MIVIKWIVAASVAVIKATTLHLGWYCNCTDLSSNLCQFPDAAVVKLTAIESDSPYKMKTRQQTPQSRSFQHLQQLSFK